MLSFSTCGLDRKEGWSELPPALFSMSVPADTQFPAKISIDLVKIWEQRIRSTGLMMNGCSFWPTKREPTSGVEAFKELKNSDKTSCFIWHAWASCSCLKPHHTYPNMALTSIDFDPEIDLLKIIIWKSMIPLPLSILNDPWIHRSVTRQHTNNKGLIPFLLQTEQRGIEEVAQLQVSKII